MSCQASQIKKFLMLTIDEAKALAGRWRAKFIDEAAFETSWSRYFETATVPDAGRLEAWLAKDLAKDEVVHAGIVKEPILPTRSRFTLNDCHHCGGKRYVRRELDIDQPGFGQAIPCPACSRSASASSGD
jgi:hypothetical protein